MNHGLILTVILAILFCLLAYLRRDIRVHMIWAGILGIPVVSYQLLATTMVSQDDFLFRVFNSIILSFLVCAVAAGVYEGFLGKHFKESVQRPSNRLWPLALIPLIFFILAAARVPIWEGLLITQISFILTLIIIRKDLLWDCLFSAVMMGLIYLLSYAVTILLSPVGTGRDQLNLLGNNIFGVPLDELVLVVFFGALWGPIYLFLKGLVRKK